MLKPGLALRVVGPTLLVSFLLLGVCVAIALYLVGQQASSAVELGENVSSNQVADDLEQSLKDLLVSLRTGNLQVDLLHEHVRQQLAAARRLADKPEELDFVERMAGGLRRYFQAMEQANSATGTARDQAVAEAARLLEKEIVPTCVKLREFNTRQISESEAAHRSTVQWVAWGLAGVGLLCSVAGIVMGYGVARGLRQSIHRLSVSVRDAAGKLRQDLPTVVLREDGDLHYLQEQMQRLVREIGQVVERLQQREREVLRADQMAAVGQMAAGVAHELRNPLTSIKLLVQANQEEAEQRGQPVEDLKIIEAEIRRMERCLQVFLDYARPPRLERSRSDLAEIVERVFTLVGGRARKQKVSLEFTPPSTPIVADVDGAQIQQLLVNLALNALDAMPGGGTLTVELDSAQDRSIELRVLDTGSGITPDNLPRLFQPFVSSKETGLGLGLVISRRIAENHGGSLRAFNRPPHGACLVLDLPAGVRSPAAVA
jgi:signal transduction histidine kinase